tara:strand:+ start:148 stop:1464 length:1317 start_codon:yes stop_codon:yes gene_type:complete
MKEKKLIAINLNEFNLAFLKHGAKKFNCKHIKEFLKIKKIETFSKDLKQDKNLDPWVQSISMNTGKRSKKHKIYNLGEKIPKKIVQIWDILSKQKKSCAIWGTMNTSFKDNSYIKIFLPDPWNHQNKVKPEELKNFYSLPREYAQNYTNFSLTSNFIEILKLIAFLIKELTFTNLIFLLPACLNMVLKKGIKNYMFFFLFDVISLKIFQNLSEKYNLNFSLIFLNSLAHYQHNNWNEESSHKHYFYFTDQILKMILELSKKYDSLIIYNGFSQKKINAQYMIRPKSPKNFLKKIGLKFNSFHSNMTNGAIVTFSNKKNFLNAIDKLKEYNICGYSVFEFKKINKNQLFIRVKIRCKKDLSFERSKLKNIKNYLFYEEKNKILKKNINFKTYDFVESMVFIKTTSKHTPNGELFFKNIKIKSKRIENIKIFKIIENFFN